MKIYYHAITTYHLLEFIVFNTLYRKGEETTLIVPKFAETKYNLNRLVEAGYFNEVAVFNYWNIPHDEKKLMLNIEKEVKRTVPYIMEADEIHIAGAQYYLSHWLIKNQKSFYFWEEASGVITYSEPVRNNVKKASPVWYKIADADGMFEGMEEHVLNRYCNIRAQHTIIDDDYIDFNVVEELKKLSQENIRFLLDFFGAPTTISLPSNSALILTQHFTNLDMMSFDEQASIYQQTVDYFLKNKFIIFKSHPEDFMYYEKLCPGSINIREKFPSELLPFFAENKSEIIATVSSTGINNISHLYERVLKFNVEYEKTFKMNHSYFSILKVLSLLQKSHEKYYLYCYGVNEVQIDNFIDFSEISLRIHPKVNQLKAYESLTKKIILLDELSNLEINVQDMFEKSNVNTIFCFTERSIPWISIVDNQKLRENLIVKRILYYVRKNIDFFDEPKFNRIFFYTENEKMREEIVKMDFEYELINSGLKIRVPEDTDAESKILMLEGILDATEARLNYYIEKEKQQ